MCQKLSKNFTLSFLIPEIFCKVNLLTIELRKCTFKVNNLSLVIQMELRVLRIWIQRLLMLQPRIFRTRKRTWVSDELIFSIIIRQCPESPLKPVSLFVCPHLKPTIVNKFCLLGCLFWLFPRASVSGRCPQCVDSVSSLSSEEKNQINNMVKLVRLICAI